VATTVRKDKEIQDGHGLQPTPEDPEEMQVGPTLIGFWFTEK
jgi:hypothetical protein